jgi:hypothetical protein
MRRIHLLCSTNWTQNPDTDRWLAPLSTMLNYIAGENCQLVRLVLIGADHQNDQHYCALANLLLSARGIKADVESRIRAGDDPAVVARLVSSAVRAAATDKAILWVDLTPGPKERSAVIFAAASAVPDALIFYAYSENDGYKVRQLARMGSYNDWLGQHGIRIRNYREELSFLAEAYEKERPIGRDEIYLAVSDLLGLHPGLEAFLSTPRTNLLTLAEWIAKDKAHELLGTGNPQWKSGEDEVIRRIDIKDSKTRSTGRACQFLYQLRCLFGHDKESGQQPMMSDAIAMLDCLAFLSSRFSDSLQADNEPLAPPIDRIFVAVDGDDVGRSFERRLADCIGVEDALALEQWSQQVQRELSDLMVRLRDHCNGAFLVRTGDGFLAAVLEDRLGDLKDEFHPKFSSITVTAGIGKTVKDAYLALKLGKAKNRGGGIFYSFNPPEERILWSRDGFT